MLTHEAKQTACRRRSHLHVGNTHERQCRLDPIDEGRGVVTSDRDLLRNRSASLAQTVEATQGDQIVGGDDRGQIRPVLSIRSQAARPASIRNDLASEI